MRLTFIFDLLFCFFYLFRSGGDPTERTFFLFISYCVLSVSPSEGVLAWEEWAARVSSIGLRILNVHVCNWLCSVNQDICCGILFDFCV